MDKLSSAERIKAISALSPTDEIMWIEYKKVYKKYKVFEIPLEYLVYNPHNGRIGSLALSYESQYEPLDPTKEEDINVIERFLWESAKSRNEKTFTSIARFGQKQIGIVTKDGVIIDGNRRALMIQKINVLRKETNKFKAIVLEDSLDGDRAAIISLETSFQMGIDSKVDYNPLEKYIRCEELMKYYPSIDDISDILAEDTTQIQEWLEILNLMIEYLDYYKTPRLFTRLDKKEGHFVDLYNYLNSYKNPKKQIPIDWQYSESDLTDLKHAYFTYIRLGIPVSKSRIIARPTSSGSFFCSESIWSKFRQELIATIDNSLDKTIDYLTLGQEFPERNFSNLINDIDTKWISANKERLNQLLYFYQNEVEDKIAQKGVLKLIRKVRITLNQINIEFIGENELIEARNDLETIEMKIKEIIAELP